MDDDTYEILRLLSTADGPRTSNKIARDLDWELGRVRSVLKPLRRSDLASSHGHGYALTPRGFDALTRSRTEVRLEKLERQVCSLVELVRDLLPKAADPSVSSAEIEAGLMDLDPVDRELYDRLRRARNHLAEILRISEYQLGQNRALRMISDQQSKTTRLLTGGDIVGLVPGMTEKTWARVGQTYLAVLERWVKEQGARRTPRSRMEVPP